MMARSDPVRLAVTYRRRSPRAKVMGGTCGRYGRVTGSESAITCMYEAFGRRDIPFVRALLASDEPEPGPEGFPLRNAGGDVAEYHFVSTW